jgi:uncharacterized membrane protein
MRALLSGFGLLVYVFPAIIGLFVIVVAVLTLLAINNLHRIPQIKSSVENIEKYLRILVEYEKKKQITPSQEENTTQKTE